jgi:hypothetical protein
MTRKDLEYFLDSIKRYERESGTSVSNDERESSEFVEIFLTINPDIKMEEVVKVVKECEPCISCKDDFCSKKNIKVSVNATWCKDYAIS